MKTGILRRGWVLLSASLLLGVWQFAASPAYAQCSDEQEAVWELFDEMANYLYEFDDYFDTDPSEKDCMNICKAMYSGCKKAGNNIVKEEKNLGKTALKAVKTLCKTADNKKACKAGVKDENQGWMEYLKELKDDFKQICDDDALAIACYEACYDDSPPDCCEEAFGIGGC